MEQLYYTDRYRKELDTKIKNLIEYEGRPALILEETIFFPGGGGQACDRGIISCTSADGSEKEIRIVETLEDKELGEVHITEEIDGTIDINKPVRLHLDWERRDDSMCQHTGQHILSGCFYSLFERNTKGLHIGKDISQLDIEGEFNDDMVAEVENMANSIICRGIETKNYILTQEERKTFKTRRPLPDTDEDIRILEIPELDINACCGVHALNTGDVKLIKIKRYYKHKDGTRFEYLAGKRAVDYVLSRERVFERVLGSFNCNEENIENAIENLNSKKDEFYEKSKYVSQKYINMYSENLIEEAEKNSDGILVIRKKFQNEEKWLISDMAKAISDREKAIVIFGNESEENSSVQLQCSKGLIKEFPYINLGKDFRECSEGLGIKGGGSGFMAQGICQNEKNIDIFLDSIYHIYIEK